MKSFRGSGFPWRSFTTAKICCLQDLRVLIVLEKDLAAFSGASTELRPSTLAAGSDGRTVRAPLRIAAETLEFGWVE